VTVSEFMSLSDMNSLNYVELFHPVLSTGKILPVLSCVFTVQKVDDKELGNYIDVSTLRSQLQAEVEKLKHLFVTQLSLRSSVGVLWITVFIMYSVNGFFSILARGPPLELEVS